MKPRSYGPFPYSPIIDRPKLEWPNGAHVALWIIPNIEYFSLEERPGGYGGHGKIPDVVMWSERDYGNRVGVFRIMDTLDRYGIRGTVALNSNLCAEHPQIIAEGNKRKWEWIGHNESNTRRLNEAPPGEEINIIRRTLETIGKAARQAADRLAVVRPAADLGHARPSGGRGRRIPGRLVQRRSAL